MEIQDERKCVKRLFGEDQLSFASSTKVLHVLGKQPQWLQTSTHEALLPSSNSPAPLLSLLTLLFFHCIYPHSTVLYMLACLLSILAVSST